MGKVFVISFYTVAIIYAYLAAFTTVLYRNKYPEKLSSTEINILYGRATKRERIIHFLLFFITSIWHPPCWMFAGIAVGIYWIFSRIVISNQLIMYSFGLSLPSAFIMAISGIVIQKSLRRIGTNVNVSKWMIPIIALTLSFGIIILFGVDMGKRIVNHIAFIFLAASFIIGVISLFFKKKSKRESTNEWRIEIKFLNRLFAKKELKTTLGVLGEASCTFDNPAYELVRSKIEEVINEKPNEIVNLIQGGTPPRQWIYTAIANLAGDLVQSGEYHMYRGVLNPLGLGKDLLRLHDSAIDELVRIGVVDSNSAATAKKAIRENIKEVG